MLVRTPSDLGALIRDRRRKLGLDQRALAQKAGTSRKWLVEVENGKPRAEIGLILRTLKALGIELNASPGRDLPHPKSRQRNVEQINLDSILDSLKKRQ
jgi:HTH-type transcriptional regulator/antitoxin HipB